MTETSTTKVSVIRSALRQEILDGRWPIGSKLPTDVELAARFQCSSGTINKAVSSFANEGLVIRKPRSGTSVIRTSAGVAASLPALDAYAFVCPNDLHEGIRRIMRGFQDAACEFRRRALVLTTGLDFRKETEIIGRLAEFDVKGVALLPVLLGAEERLQFSQMVLACPFPVVLIQTAIPDLGRTTVRIDSLHAGYVTARHLLERGFKRVGFLTNDAWNLLVREKHAGYRQAMYEAGLDAECQKFSHLMLEMRPDFLDPMTEPRAIAKAYLKAHPDVEAVVCGGDFLALALVEAALEMGIPVPGGLQVTGMEDLQQAASGAAPLTTFRYPFEAIGQEAFKALDRIVSNGAAQGEEIQLRGELILRASTAS